MNPEATLLCVLREHGPGIAYEQARMRWQARLGLPPGNASALRFHALVESLEKRGVISRETGLGDTSLLGLAGGAPSMVS